MFEQTNYPAVNYGYATAALDKLIRKAVKWYNVTSGIRYDGSDHSRGLAIDFVSDIIRGYADIPAIYALWDWFRSHPEECYKAGIVAMSLSLGNRHIHATWNWERLKYPQTQFFLETENGQDWIAYNDVDARKYYNVPPSTIPDPSDVAKVDVDGDKKPGFGFPGMIFAAVAAFLFYVISKRRK